MPVLVMDIVGLIIDLPTVVTPERWRQIQQQPNLDIPPVVPLRQMQRVFQGFTVHLISAAMGKQRERVQSWLDDWKFFTATGIPPANLHFCDGPLQKGAMCTSFSEPPHIAVDDNPEALQSLYDVVPNRIFFDRGECVPQPAGTIRVASWSELNDTLQRMKH